MDTVSSGDTEKANLAGALALGLDYHKMGFPGGSDSKESACNAGDLGLIPESGRSSGERTGYPFQYSCLEHSMDRRVWCTTVHRIPKSWTLLRLTLSLSR